MRVLYFHQHFTSPSGSGGIRSYAFAMELLNRGVECTIVCGSLANGHTGLSGDFIKGKRSGKYHGIDIIEFDIEYSNSHNYIKRVLLFFRYAICCVKLIFSEEYNIIFATSTPLTAALPGIIGRWLLRKPFVFEVRDLWPELPREMGVVRNPILLGAMSALEWLSYRSAHRLVGLSPGIVDGIARRGVPRNLIATIPNGCDLDIFEETVEPWRPVPVKSTDFMALFAGTHGVANGLDAILDAAVVLKMRGRDDIKLVLVGQGKLKAKLQARAASDGLDNVVFHDPVNKQRLAGLMAATDLGLQVLANVPAFYYGTSPNKFFDYIAAGLPVLNNYPGWLAEMIEHHQCGFVVSPDDPVAFSDALENAASDRAALKVMGENGRKLAQDEFSRKKLAGKWVDWVTGPLL